MVRDWDVVREVLIEVEGLTKAARSDFAYSTDPYGEETPTEDHALLLWRAGFLDGVGACESDENSLQSPILTWQGHELLETMRSKPVWEEIKKSALEKGLGLTLESVKMLSVVAYKALIG